MNRITYRIRMIKAKMPDVGILLYISSLGSILAGTLIAVIRHWNEVKEFIEAVASLYLTAPVEIKLVVLGLVLMLVYTEYERANEYCWRRR